MKKQFNKIISIICSFVLVAAIALTFSSCKGEKTTSAESSIAETQATQTKKIGEGKTKFGLTVTDNNGESTDFEILTDEKTVGDALLKLGLISGEKSDYGLYIKTVNGIVADYDKDKTYWAFYIDGQYASSGADQTEIESGKTYELKIEK